MLGAIGVSVFAGRLVNQFLHIPPELRRPTLFCVYVVAVGLPITMALNLLASVLTGLQRFDLYNKTVPGLYVFQSLLMVLILRQGGSLGELAVMAVLLWSIGLGVLMGNVWRVVSPRALLPRLDGQYVRMLFRYGLFVTLNGLAGLMQWRFEKLVLAAFLPIKSLTYYVIPFNLANRLRLIPSTITPVLFPVISGLAGLQKEIELRDLYARAGRMLAAVMIPAGVLIIGFASNILRLWLGPEYARESTLILQMLTAGMILNALAYLPATVSDATGRPDIHAYIALLSGAASLVLGLSLVRWLGARGIAAGLATSLLAHFLLFVWRVEKKLVGFRIKEAAEKIYAKPMMLGGALLAGVLLLKQGPWGPAGLAMGGVFLAGLYALAAYFVLLEREEQHLIQRWLYPLIAWGRTF